MAQTVIDRLADLGVYLRPEILAQIAKVNAEVDRLTDLMSRPILWVPKEKAPPDSSGEPNPTD